MRDIEVIDAELRLVAAVRQVCREAGGPLPDVVVVDELLDERARTYARMVELQRIGHTGRPITGVFRPFDPPQTVLVDLSTLFPHQPHQRGGYHEFGLQMSQVVEGQLSCWAAGEQGGWWGLVTYSVIHGTEKQTVTHWIPAWVLKRKDSRAEG